MRQSRSSIFWPTLRDRVPHGDQLADHAIRQEGEAKEVLARLDKLVPSDPEFEDLLAKFIPAAREHISYEEQQVWPPLRQVAGSRLRRQTAGEAGLGGRESSVPDAHMQADGGAASAGSQLGKIAHLVDDPQPVAAGVWGMAGAPG